jgi:branched-chain amino acid transport system permease protein
LGGAEDTKGAMLGAVMLTLISEALWARYPYHYMIILGVIIILTVKFMPLGILYPIKQRFLRRRQRTE